MISWREEKGGKGNGGKGEGVGKGKEGGGCGFTIYSLHIFQKLFIFISPPWNINSTGGKVGLTPQDTYFLLKGLSQEMNLAFDDIYG
jgi:hypothetical protein